MLKHLVRENVLEANLSSSGVALRSGDRVGSGDLLDFRDGGSGGDGRRRGKTSRELRLGLLGVGHFGVGNDGEGGDSSGVEEGDEGGLADGDELRLEVTKVKVGSLLAGSLEGSVELGDREPQNLAHGPFSDSRTNLVLVDDLDRSLLSSYPLGSEANTVKENLSLLRVVVSSSLALLLVGSTFAGNDERRESVTSDEVVGPGVERPRTLGVRVLGNGRVGSGLGVGSVNFAFHLDVVTPAHQN